MRLMSEARGTFKCEKCGTSFNSQEELNNHGRQAHSGGEQSSQSTGRM
jgi:hypothetical protein